MLPAVGIAMLLNYMPTGKLVNYLLIGFFLAAFLKVPIIGAAIIGFAAAFATYKQAEKEGQNRAAASAVNTAGIVEDE